VDPERIRAALAQVAPEPRLLVVSAATGEGIGEWVAWLRERRAKLTQAAAGGHHHHSHAHD